MALPAGQDFNDVPRCLLIWPVVRSNTTCSTCNTVVLYSANNSNEIKIRCFSIVFTVLKRNHLLYTSTGLLFSVQIFCFSHAFYVGFLNRKKLTFAGQTNTCRQCYRPCLCSSCGWSGQSSYWTKARMLSKYD